MIKEVEKTSKVIVKTIEYDEDISIDIHVCSSCGECIEDIPYAKYCAYCGIVLEW